MLKFIIVILCIFFLLRAFSKIFVVRTFNAMNQKMQDEFNRQRGTHQQMPEGSISIDPGVEKKSKRKDDSDDYVDFEEVK